MMLIKCIDDFDSDGVLKKNKIYKAKKGSYGLYQINNIEGNCWRNPRFIVIKETKLIKILYENR